MSGHVKFGDNGMDEANKPSPEITLVDEKKKTQKIIDNDSDSDSDDEAPEEEGMTDTKKILQQKEKAIAEAKKQEQQALKEKRRQQDARFREQQANKKSKEVNIEGNEETPLEELSEDFFQELEESENASQQINQIPTHINFNDIAETEYIPEIKKQLNKKKKNTLKKLRKVSLNKGPVKISVLSSNITMKSLAPKKEKQIMSTKDKWLKRKSLNKK